VTCHKDYLHLIKIYRYQKISIFGAKKNIYRELLTNNILYLHIEKNITSK
jgi:hypothetical protein